MMMTVFQFLRPESVWFICSLAGTSTLRSHFYGFIAQSKAVRNNKYYVCEVRARWKAGFGQSGEHVRPLRKVKSLPRCFPFPPLCWPSPDHGSSPLNDTKTTSPRKGRKLPAFPRGRESKIHCCSCASARMCFLRGTQERGGLCQHAHVSWLP